MITRITFDAEFLEAICRRGLTLTELARRTGLSAATVSSAVSGKPTNIRTAVVLAKVVATAPIVEGLETWIRPVRNRPERPNSTAQPTANLQPPPLGNLPTRWSGSPVGGLEARADDVVGVRYAAPAAPAAQHERWHSEVGGDSASAVLLVSAPSSPDSAAAMPTFAMPAPTAATIPRCRSGPAPPARPSPNSGACAAARAVKWESATPHASKSAAVR